MKAKVLALLPVLSAAGLAAHDLWQKNHSLLRNYPVIGHARYAIETIGPELRQYVVASNDEERPFSRHQRAWIYASAKGENNYVGFGTDNNVEDEEGYPIIKHRTFSLTPPSAAPHTGDHVDLPSAKLLGGATRAGPGVSPGVGP
ncbi:hypothetical protein [Flexivirga alba]|uniref:Uncharacterized protein n=1 Tax=Flexivirga alba TaxID=702742 RepID=A0ABW2AKT2_9MICO